MAFDLILPDMVASDKVLPTNIRVKSLRQRRLAADSPASAPSDAPDDESDRSSEPDVGQKLTAAQRRVVLRVVARYHHTSTIQAVLQEEHSDIPRLSDQTIRYYRRKVDSGTLKDPEQAWRETLGIGLARREVRIANLARQAETLATQIADMADTPLRAQYWREWREMLRQIAAESGQALPPGPPGPPTPAGAGDEVPPEVADVYMLLQQMNEQQAATNAALSGAQRPPVEESE